MKLIKAEETNISSILKIIHQAQIYFKENGINQWQNNYPNIETIKADICKGNSYILIKNNNVIATVCISFDEETTYKKIYDGAWPSNQKYGVIHRIAVDNKYKGLGISTSIIKNIENICCKKGIKSIRVDTHEDNISMQRLLEKNKFKYCGIIYLIDNSKRLAYEKEL